VRILHVSPYFSDAWGYGGIPRVVAALTRGLAGRGHQVTVCTTDARDETCRLPAGTSWTGEGVEVRIFRNVSNALAYKRQIFLPEGLDSYLRDHAADFDVAHLHACRNLLGVLAARHLRRAGVPYVVMPNGTAPVIERQKMAKRIFDTFLGRQLLRDAAGVIAVSAAEQKQLRALDVDASRIRRLPNPVELDDFAEPIPRGRFRAQHKLAARPLVMFLGRITPRKNVDVLIRAFARLDGHATLVVAGNVPQSSNALGQLAQTLGVEDRTLFTGLLQGRERLEALTDADVLVYPSQDEVFGLVPLEALLCGTPVVVSDDSGCGEVIQSVGGGLTTPVADTEALARAIAEVLQKPVIWRQLASQAGQHIERTFGSQGVCRQLEEIYCDVTRAA
jgi:glycosyltransferase involved in cell wall biosynthesis